jgi:hypothetical protein
MSETPRTDDFLSKNSSYLEKLAFMQKLERELAEAKETIQMLETRHGATMLCHEAQMDEVTKQRDALAEALETLERTAGLPALQNDPARVQARKVLASVKGGSHE